jgi:fibronectin type III domain protein
MKRSLDHSTVWRGTRLISVLALTLLVGCSHSRPGQEPHSVTLKWDPSKYPVAGYNVYRGFETYNPVKLNPTPLTQTEYTDVTVEAGRTYSYYVTAVTPKGAESGPSEILAATIPAKIPIFTRAKQWLLGFYQAHFQTHLRTILRRLYEKYR